MTEPLTPREAKEAWEDANRIPDVVYQVVNDLIKQHFTGNSATMKQSEILERLETAGIGSQEAFDKRWMDFEPQYRARGWEVEYDRPGYNETYPAVFKFTIPS